MRGVVTGRIALPLFFCAFFCAFLLESLLRGPVLSPDSAGYLQGVMGRPPLYPLWLAVTAIWPDKSGLFIAVFFQTIFVLAASSVLIRVLWRTLVLPPLLQAILFIVLNLPLLGARGIGSAILTESLAYGLLLLFWSALLLFFLRGKLQMLALAMVFWLLAILTRPQMLFFIAALLPVGLWVLRSGRFRVLPIVFLAFLLPVVLGRSLEGAYNYIRHRSLEARPVTGLQFTTPLFYLARESDSGLFPEEDRHYFIEVHNRLRTGQWLIEYNQAPNFLRHSMHYLDNWNHVCYRGTYAAYLAELDLLDGTDLFSLQPEKVRFLNERLWRIGIILYKKYYKEHARLVLGSIIFIMGGLTYPLLLCCAGLLALLSFWRSSDLLALSLLGALALHGFNYLVSGTMNALMLRYSFYTDILVLAHLLMVLAAWAGPILPGPLPGSGSVAPEETLPPGE
ncbi:MAG: hypothetical protein HS115_19545 [Spirochaetales bacterium]|nr:hypothetical protein [Spirochaetales bacterium]